jgi:hypothetical protein
VSSFENSDFLLKIYMVWAEFEAYKAKDADKMKEIMEKAIRICAGDEHYWSCYLEYLKHFGSIKEIRGIYKRAVQYVKSEKLAYSQYWVAWEKM